MWQGTEKGPGSPTAPKHRRNPNGFSSATTRNLLVLVELPARPAASPQQARPIDTPTPLAVLMPNPTGISMWE